MFGNIMRRFGWVGFLSILALILVFGLNQGVTAQGPESTSVPASGSSQIGPEVEQLPLEPESLAVPAGESTPQAETYIGPEGEVLYGGSGALQAQQGLTVMTPVTETVGAYFNISASNFTPREEAATRAYGGAGCAYRTSASGFFTSDLQLPDSVKIVTIRAQYYDASPDDGIVYLYSYDGGGGFQQLGQAITSGTAGYGTSFSPAINHLVDNENESLALILDYSTANDSSLRFCNIRVTYNREVALPVVVK